MRKIAALLVFLFLSAGLLAQPERIGIGLDFSTGLMFNTQKTGNPALLLKTWVPLDKRDVFFLVPSVAVFSPYRFSNGYYILKNYMFHGDLDGQFRIFEDKTLRIIGFAGGNFMYLSSFFKPIVVTGYETITDTQDMAAGGNIGAGLEMRMSSFFDFNLTGKYTISKSLGTPDLYKQAVISVQAVYYFHPRGRGPRR